ncbi:hypothetical protein CEP53_004482 [Fusarium sp. AF-6]|nr:hypothetical protein CEP53_004482 [Fusarium sp. AF-6]
MPPDDDPACLAEGRCAQCSRIPWNIQVWKLLARFRKSRDPEYETSWVGVGSLDDLDFALDALGKECIGPSPSEHADDAFGGRGNGRLHPNQVKALLALAPDPCDGDLDSNSAYDSDGVWYENRRAWSGGGFFSNDDDDDDDAERDRENFKIIISLTLEHSTTTVYFNHHPSLVALEHAADMGCHLCRSLRASLKPWPSTNDDVQEWVRSTYPDEPTLQPELFIRIRHPRMTALEPLQLSRVPGELADEQKRVSFCKSLLRETLDDDLESLVLEVIRPWVDDCDVGRSLHQQCPPVVQRNSDLLPTRLIDVGTCPTDNVRLVVTGEDIPKATERPKYLTLSYCWGHSNGAAKTTLQNIEERRKNINTKSLPLTIQDAIRLTKVMKIRYLWVDALCIIQNLEDFHLEAAKMGSYYANGYCLISATGFSNSSQGLFADRKVRKLRGKTCTLGYDNQHQRFWLLQNPYTDLEVEPCFLTPVMDRAWCLQERLLSRRILHFTPEEVFWGCHSIPEISESYCNPEAQPSESEVESRIAHTADKWGLSPDHPLRKTEKFKWIDQVQRVRDEPLRNYIPRLITSYDRIFDRPSTSDMWLAWTKLIQEYLGMGLSEEDDRLTAIQGLGHRLAEHYGDRYFGGIFLSHLAHGLLWKGEKRPSDRRSTRCPSWSWGVAKWVEFINLEHSLVSSIEQDSVFPSSTGVVEMMGRDMRRLHLRAPLVPMPNMPVVDRQQLWASAPWANRKLTFVLRFDEQSLVPNDLGHVRVMLLGYTNGYYSLVGLVVRNCVGNYRYLER